MIWYLPAQEHVKPEEILPLVNIHQSPPPIALKPDSIEYMSQFCPAVDAQGAWGGEWSSGLAWDTGLSMMTGGSAKMLSTFLIDSCFEAYTVT